jgi:hypothetical protein
MAEDRKITVSHRIPIELDDWLEREKKERGVTKSEILLDALQKAREASEAKDAEKAPVAA